MIPSHHGSKYNDAEPVAATRNNFVSKLFRMLQELEVESRHDIVCWQSHGKAFRVNDIEKFETIALPRFFRHSKMSSFQRQLNIYNFHRISSGRDQNAYYHQYFVRDQPTWLSRILREATKGHGVRRPDLVSDPPDLYNDSAVIASSSTANAIPAVNQLLSLPGSAFQPPSQNFIIPVRPSVDPLLMQIMLSSNSTPTRLSGVYPNNPWTSPPQQLPPSVQYNEENDPFDILMLPQGNDSTRRLNSQPTRYINHDYNTVAQLVATLLSSVDTSSLQQQTSDVSTTPPLNSDTIGLIANLTAQPYLLSSLVTNNSANSRFNNSLGHGMGQLPLNVPSPPSPGPTTDQKNTITLLDRLLTSAIESQRQQTPVTGSTTENMMDAIQRLRQQQTQMAEEGQRGPSLEQFVMNSFASYQQHATGGATPTSDTVDLRQQQEAETLNDIADLLTQQLQHQHRHILNNNNDAAAETSTRPSTNAPASEAIEMASGSSNSGNNTNVHYMTRTSTTRASSETISAESVPGPAARTSSIKKAKPKP